jgi:hypothetical protein
MIYLAGPAPRVLRYKALGKPSDRARVIDNSQSSQNAGSLVITTSGCLGSGDGPQSIDEAT